MPEEKEFQLPKDFPLVSGESPAFAPEEMVACERCRRANPPTRMSCLYCGDKLPATGAGAALRRPALRPLDAWEQGFNVVLIEGGAGAVGDDDLQGPATLLRMDVGLFRDILNRRDALPVARAATAEEAELVARRLCESGFGAEVISDASLSAVESCPPARVRRLELTEGALMGWTAAGEPVSTLWDDVEVIAVGRIYMKRVEVEERRGRVKSGGEVADAREMFADDMALEIYSRGDGAGWRIMAAGFDYSCLGERMGLLAGENFKTLVGEVRRRATAASFDDKYDGLRHLLGAAWPNAEGTEAGGLKRERPGRFNTEAVTAVTNDSQFTRYARLRRLLSARARAA